MVLVSISNKTRSRDFHQIGANNIEISKFRHKYIEWLNIYSIKSICGVECGCGCARGTRERTLKKIKWFSAENFLMAVSAEGVPPSGGKWKFFYAHYHVYFRLEQKKFFFTYFIHVGRQEKECEKTTYKVSTLKDVKAWKWKSNYTRLRPLL